MYGRNLEGEEEHLALPLLFIKDVKSITTVSLQVGDLENIQSSMLKYS